jgi:hypothetical protein
MVHARQINTGYSTLPRNRNWVLTAIYPVSKPTMTSPKSIYRSQFLKVTETGPISASPLLKQVKNSPKSQTWQQSVKKWQTHGVVSKTESMCHSQGYGRSEHQRTKMLFSASVANSVTFLAVFRPFRALFAHFW